MVEEKKERKGSMKKLLLISGLVVVAIIVVVAMTRQHPEPEVKVENEQVIDVKTVTLSSASVANTASASGTVLPIVEAKIAPKIMSTVSAINVDEGDHVSRGQVLIRLESRDLQAQLAQAQAALSAAAAGSDRAYTAIDLQKAQTSTGIASAEAGLRAAKEHLSLVNAGPRKQQRAQAHFAVAQAEAQLKNAEMELNRMKRLYEQDVITKQRLDGVQTAYDIASAQFDSAKEQASLTEEGSRTQEIEAAKQQVQQAEEALRMAKASRVQNKMSVSNSKVASSQVAQARAAVDFARTQLGYATIISPVSGIVSARMIDPGDTVSPGIPMISIQADSHYRLEATVPEIYARDMSVGKSMDVSIGAGDRTARGTIAVISPAGDPASHKFIVKVDLPASLKARSGEFGRISFPVSYSRGITIPKLALHDEGGLPAVYTVDKENKARMQTVKIGNATKDGFEVLSGLKPGDRIIIENTGVLSDGVSVKAEGL